MSNKLNTPMVELSKHFVSAWSSPSDCWNPDMVITKIESMTEKEKEFARQCFQAGLVYATLIQIDEPAIKPPVNFDEWYEKTFNQ
jgi:hypothetical protein